MSISLEYSSTSSFFSGDIGANNQRVMSDGILEHQVHIPGCLRSKVLDSKPAGRSEYMKDPERPIGG